MKRKIIWIVLSLLMTASAITACATPSEEKPADKEKISIDVLILPKFEVGEMSGDFAGEAQFYYEEYLEGSDIYDIDTGEEDLTLYVRDSVALCVIGQGKVRSSLNTYAVLTDDRFDFSDAYIIATGCAGGATGTCVPGDVVIGTAAVDFDLGHTVDSSELTTDSGVTWFADEEYEEDAVILMNSELADKAYDIAKDAELETTENAQKLLADMYPGETWDDRGPAVIKGTSVTSDNFWKGEYPHNNAVHAAEHYGCPDPYAVTEMEDAAVAATVRRLGMLDRLIILRNCVNIDMFMPGSGPEELWGDGKTTVADDDSEESLDIFPAATENNFKAGRLIIDSILNGKM